MKRLSTEGGFPSESIQRAKAELAETLEFSEQQEVLPRNRDGRVSAGGYIETHFSFAETKDVFCACSHERCLRVVQNVSDGVHPFLICCRVQ